MENEQADCYRDHLNVFTCWFIHVFNAALWRSRARFAILRMRIGAIDTGAKERFDACDICRPVSPVASNRACGDALFPTFLRSPGA